jgi:hypothetical protein
MALNDAWIWTLGEVDQKYQESVETWRWRKMEFSWTDRAKNELLLTVKEERNILHTTNRKKANWIGHILHKNCFLIHVTEGKTERSDGRKRK